MEWYEKFKRFLGFPGRQESSSPQAQDRWVQPPSRNEEFEPSFFSSPSRSFNMFTDPLEIHKYFEQQMSEMLRNFGFNEDFSHQFNSPEIEDFTYPRIEEIPNEQPPSRDLREQFLKPGFENREGQSQNDKVDRDIDGRLNLSDWGSVFKGERQLTPKTKVFGQSVTSRTIRNTDGSTETHITVKDNEGNEKTTITKKIGDKEYSITKKRDKDGKEETIENLVNLNENEVENFFPELPKLPAQGPHNQWTLFDRFFK